MAMDTETYQQVNMALHVAIILILLWLIFYRKEGLQSAQGGSGLSGYVGSGVNNQVFTSGATMRRLAQKFSSANQAQYLTVHNAEKPDHKINLAVTPIERFQPAQGGAIVNADLSGYVGDGVQNQVFASGSTMRRLSQLMTSANQGDVFTIHHVSNPAQPPLKVVVIIV